MLDNYAHEYEELVRARDAHKLEMENLKNTNARLASQVYAYRFVSGPFGG